MSTSTFLCILIGFLVFLVICDIISHTNDSKKSNINIEKSSAEFEKELEAEEYKKALEEYCTYPVNDFITNWVNTVLNDGVRNFTYKSGNYYIIIETKNYVMHYWISNKFYGYGSHGQIYDKNEFPAYPMNDARKYCNPDIFFPEKKPIVTWDEQMTNKETRYKVFSIIKGYEKNT